MFTAVDSPTGHFILKPIPRRFFELPPVFGGGALLVLHRFTNGSSALEGEHFRGITIAAAQARSNFGEGEGSLEVYGMTDRTGSEALNKTLSTQRAERALAAMNSAMGLGPAHARFANGLGERFADEYFQQADDSRNEAFRGVALYLWESFDTARDLILRLEIAFAAPPLTGESTTREFLAALHMGRHRAQPPSPFR